VQDTSADPDLCHRSFFPHDAIHSLLITSASCRPFDCLPYDALAFEMQTPPPERRGLA
jgi:hypothetical protein